MAIAHLAAGRYEEGLPWAERALRDNAGAVALRLKLSLCGHLGRLDDARQCLRLLREIDPKPIVATAGGRGWGSAGLAARVREGLRKAGLPEE